MKMSFRAVCRLPSFRRLVLSLLIALCFPGSAYGEYPDDCEAASNREPALNRELVLRFFQTTDALEQTADLFGLSPFVSSRSTSGRPTPHNIAQSLSHTEQARGRLERHLRDGEFCSDFHFAYTQRAIYKAQNFIDLGEDEGNLERQLNDTCRSVCTNLFALMTPRQPDCFDNCKISQTNWFERPSDNNLDVMRRLQGEIPTAYILSWQTSRSRNGR